MKSKVFAIAFALILALTITPAMAKKDPGRVAIPKIESAEGDSESVTVCWQNATTDELRDLEAMKFSIVLMFEAGLTWGEECLSTMECGEVPGSLEIELDFGTMDAEDIEGLYYSETIIVVDEFTSYTRYCLSISEALMEEYTNDYLEAIFGLCDDCIDGWEPGMLEVKVKGLNPGKGKRRQNNTFSETLPVTYETPPIVK